MADQKPKTADEATPEEVAEFAKKWVGTEKDENGVVRAIKTMKGNRPYMATFDKDGKPTGHGIV